MYRLAAAAIVVVCLLVAPAPATAIPDRSSSSDPTDWTDWTDWEDWEEWEDWDDDDLPGWGEPSYAPGAPGLGDPYFPLDGNGGYDVAHYDLRFSYQPSTNRLRGVATIRAEATQNLSSFNLDLHGLTVRSITVDGDPATWTRAGDELTITPEDGIRSEEDFRVVIVYDGVPETIGDSQIGVSGFIHTDDGTLVAGQPDVAATWFPVNDHPLDKASYTFTITVPAGVDAIANGELKSSVTRNGLTTWVWDAQEPMASYLTTATIGQFDLRAYTVDGIHYWDALDPDLFDGPVPATGNRFAYSQVANLSYKRLARRIAVPAGGGQLTFKVDRDTEPNWDFMFVEARLANTNAWTTLPDLNGHTSSSTGLVCPYWLGLHPFLEHYQTPTGPQTCSPTGTTGTWSAASGASDGYEQWAVDLSAYAGKEVIVSISYVSDDIIQHSGVVVDDIVGPGGVGSTSFEADGNTYDGWVRLGPPPGSAPNENDWRVAEAGDVETVGSVAEEALSRQPEIIAFLSGIFGDYPFSSAGGIVDDFQGLGFALETQTRPVYALDFFTEFADPAEWVVVHELAHQWVGDYVALGGWQHIWLNEGFATYAEWLWSENQGRATAQQYFDFYASTPAASPFWSVEIGDPGPDNLFHPAVYDRGAMTLHALRLRLGDTTFFRLVREWIEQEGGGNVTTPEFIALAEQLSGQNLDAFFDAWLFTPAKPTIPAAATAKGSSSAASALAAKAARKGAGPRR